MIDLNKLKKEQLKLAKKITTNQNLKKIISVAGASRAYIGNKIISSVVVCDYKSLKVIEKQHSISEAKIPYTSGLLFYREGPAVIEAYNKLEKRPDVLIVEGNGILHPRKIGMASHLGILLDIPTKKKTKRLMLGQIREKTIYSEKEAIGYELTTKEHSKPIYISPGHKISLKSSLEVIKGCLRFPHKLPEPLHLAHKYANKVKNESSIIETQKN